MEIYITTAILRHILKPSGNTMDLITGDGGFDNSDDYNRQEMIDLFRNICGITFTYMEEHLYIKYLIHLKKKQCLVIYIGLSYKQYHYTNQILVVYQIQKSMLFAVNTKVTRLNI